MMSSDGIKRVRVIVRGRVQGVAFRYYAVDRARELGVRGWVRNLYSGEVEALVEGDRPDVEQMISWLRTGPSLAHVTDMTVTEERPVPGEYSGFTIIH
jgi:acylphosphatase